MVKVIDVHDLPDEDVKQVRGLVEQLRQKKKAETIREEVQKETLRSWPMGAQGTFSRKELYEDI